MNSKHSTYPRRGVGFIPFLGQARAKSGTVQKLRQVFMVSEARYTLPKNDDAKHKQISQTPNRVDVLIIAGLQIKENTRQTKIFEMSASKSY